MKTINNINQLAKGQKVKVTNNEIFGYMGYEEVTGEVFFINTKTGNTFSILCDQTGAIELVTINDGLVQAI